MAHATLPTLRQQLTEAFGSSVFAMDGSLDRAYLAGIVFQDQSQLEKLNSIVHPAVKEDGLVWDELHTDTPYTLREAALLLRAEFTN
ncbi:MAG: dephospho-CoA kinase [Saprospiraceae bacterium]